MYEDSITHKDITLSDSLFQVYRIKYMSTPWKVMKGAELCYILSTPGKSLYHYRIYPVVFTPSQKLQFVSLLGRIPYGIILNDTGKSFSVDPRDTQIPWPTEEPVNILYDSQQNRWYCDKVDLKAKADFRFRGGMSIIGPIGKLP